MLAIPSPKISQEQLNKFLKNPEVLTLEFLFVLLTISNVLVVYRLLTYVIPYPITITWVQLFYGLVFSLTLGESGKEFPKFGFFPRFTISTEKLTELFLPTLAYLSMITLANVLLASTQSIATYPVLLSLGVFLHHVARFIGCGQIYMPIRWISITIMLTGFLLAIVDKTTMGPKLFPLALLYALSSSIFRGWCLEKAMHVVDGKGNALHNHQVAIGLAVLPIVILVTGEARFITYMPYTYGKIYTWQTWGCLVTVGTLPFIKNVVANRLIRKTGQAPWRALELASVILVFIIGICFWDEVSIIGWISSVLVLTGRTLGMLDVLSKEPEPIRQGNRESQSEVTHSAPPSKIFEQDEELSDERNNQIDREEVPPPQPILEGIPSHEAARPFLGGRLSRMRSSDTRNQQTPHLTSSEIEMFEPLEVEQ